MNDIYARQISLPEIGPEGQKKLNAGSVLVIGIGGLGCASLPYLAASGIQRIGMVDFDRIEGSNLARQTLFSTKDIGRWKAEVAKERLLALYPNTHFQQETCRLTHQNAQDLLSNYDIILDGTDNLQARLAINDACTLLQKPWVYGSIHQWEGQVSLFLPKNPNYRSLFPEGTMELSLPNCSSTGVLGPFAGMIGTIQAIEAIKWLADIEDNLAAKILIIDGKTWRLTLTDILSSAANYEISHSLLKKWMANDTIQLIDARKPEGTLSKNQKVVVYCQSGRKSVILMRQLRREGFEAYSLQGGINFAK
jgi:adenylyltransferase/sulfurtransferase